MHLPSLRQVTREFRVAPDAPARCRLCVIFNPHAGLRRRGRLERTVDALEALGCDVWMHRTDRAGHAESIARELPACDRVVVAGGDGTVHEVLNGLRGRDVPVALIPLGTANVLAHELGLPRRPAALARAIVTGPAHTVALGEILRPGADRGRLFVQMAGIGFDARVVARATGRLKRRLRQFAFVVAFARVMVGYGRPRYRVTLDGATSEAPFVVIANGRFYGGPFRIAPEARPWLPELHACLFKTGGVPAAVRYGLALITNRLPRQPDFEIRRGTDIAVDGPEGDPIQADGELAGYLPVRVRVVVAGARLVLPPADG